MDNEARPPIAAQLTDAEKRWQTLSQLSDQQLHYLFGGAADELQRRAKATNDPNRARHLLCASSRLVEARVYMRQLAFRSDLSAAPPVELPHGAADSAPELTLRRGRQSSGTTGGAAESPQSWSGCLFCNGDTHDAPGRVYFGVLGPFCSVDHREQYLDMPGNRGTHPAEPLTAESRGQRGPEAAEGAGAAGRAEKGPVDLSDHLRLVKSEGGAR